MLRTVRNTRQFYYLLAGILDSWGEKVYVMFLNKVFVSALSLFTSTVSSSVSLSGLTPSGTMEQPDPASDAHMIERSLAEAVSETAPPVKPLHACTSDLEKGKQISDNNKDEGENGSSTEDEVQFDSEFVKTTTDISVDIKTELDAQTHCQELVGRMENSDNSTVSVEDRKLDLSLSNEASGPSETTTLADVGESSSTVLEGTMETSPTLDDGKESLAITQIRDEQPSVVVGNISSEPSPSNDSGILKSPSSPSVHSTSKHSCTESATTSGISNGPSTPSSDTIGSSLASSANTPAPSHSSSSPYDTDCSRKLISEIQRSLSQESLLDELESELLACQLPEGESDGNRKGSPPVNGLPADQEGCMMVFEKCVQYKYTQQEKAIQR